MSKSLERKNKKPRVLSLFSGAGGLDIGFRDSNFDIVESVEIERRFCDSLLANAQAGKMFQNTKVNCIDIREYGAKHLSDIDFVIGGPPCQTFSAAGRRANGVMGTDDPRGVLFREYVRILEETAPKGFLFENVYGITGAQGGKPWKCIVDSFSDLGYKLSFRILDAADYGVPQHRERLIIVGLREGEFMFPRPTHGPDSLDGLDHYTAHDAICDIDMSNSNGKIPGKYSELLKGIPPGLNYSYYTEEMGHPNPVFAWRSKFSDFLYKADPNSPVRTIKAQGGQWTGPIHWDDRHFTVEELKRLQTFPDEYRICGNRQTAIHQIGNSVPPQLSRILALSVADQVFNMDMPFKTSYLSQSETLGFRQRKRDLTSVYRSKAKQAISAQKPERSPCSDHYVFSANLHENHRFETSESMEHTYQISADWADSLDVSVKNRYKNHEAPFYAIEIVPSVDWALGVDNVTAHVFDDDLRAYTVAWKSIGRAISSRAIKDDLVQLNGYYQYKPRIRCRIIRFETTLDISVLTGVVSGKAVRMMLPTAELAEEWGVPESRVLEEAEKLKKVGYEIRNHNTNSQIEDGMWLIPYAFPTPTHLGVQLNKQLTT
jgi:DNA (cytosine-5)-methyltransferase 1